MIGFVIFDNIFDKMIDKILFNMDLWFEIIFLCGLAFLMYWIPFIFYRLVLRGICFVRFKYQVRNTKKKSDELVSIDEKSDHCESKESDGLQFFCECLDSGEEQCGSDDSIRKFNRCCDIVPDKNNSTLETDGKAAQSNQNKQTINKQDTSSLTTTAPAESVSEDQGNEKQNSDGQLQAANSSSNSPVDGLESSLSLAAEKTRRILADVARFMREKQEQPATSSQFPNEGTILMDIDILLRSLSAAQEMISKFRITEKIQISDNRIVNVKIPSNANVQSDSVISNFQQDAKEWHKQINAEFREHLVKFLIRAVVPTSNNIVTVGGDRNFPNSEFNRRTSPIVIEDRIMRNLEPYVRKSECVIYEAANSISEYYHLIAEKYYKIREEFGNVSTESDPEIGSQVQNFVHEPQKFSPPFATVSSPTAPSVFAFPGQSLQCTAAPASSNLTQGAAQTEMPSNLNCCDYNCRRATCKTMKEPVPVSSVLPEQFAASTQQSQPTMETTSNVSPEIRTHKPPPAFDYSGSTIDWDATAEERSLLSGPTKSRSSAKSGTILNERTQPYVPHTESRTSGSPLKIYRFSNSVLQELRTKKSEEVQQNQPEVPEEATFSLTSSHRFKEMLLKLKKDYEATSDGSNNGGTKEVKKNDGNGLVEDNIADENRSPFQPDSIKSSGNNNPSVQNVIETGSSVHSTDCSETVSSMQTRSQKSQMKPTTEPSNDSDPDAKDEVDSADENDPKKNNFNDPEFLSYLEGCKTEGIPSIVEVSGAVLNKTKNSTSEISQLEKEKVRFLFLWMRYPDEKSLAHCFPNCRNNKEKTTQLIHYFQELREIFFKKIEPVAKRFAANETFDNKGIKLLCDEFVTYYTSGNPLIVVPSSFYIIVTEWVRLFYDLHRGYNYYSQPSAHYSCIIDEITKKSSWPIPQPTVDPLLLPNVS